MAIIGSGPAGLAAAQQLTRAGHTVTVFERADRAGGLMRYGIPEFKMEKAVLDRRLEQMKLEGTQFRVNTWVGGPADDDRSISVADVRDEFDAIVLAGERRWLATFRSRAVKTLASTRPWTTSHQPTGYSSAISNRRQSTLPARRSSLSAAATRGRLPRHCPSPRRASVHQFEIMPRPPEQPQRQNAVANVPAGLQGDVRPRRGRRACIR
ncbi:MAG: NAD(P)-binding protein [Acidimicrobiales bacterium]